MRQTIIEIDWDIYETELSDEQILEEYPNSYDMDAVPFYEAIEFIFNVDSYTDGDRDTSVKESIDSVSTLWDGKESGTHPWSDSFDPEAL